MERAKRFWLELVMFLILSLPTGAMAAEITDLVLMSSVVGGIGYQYSMGVNKVIQKVLPEVRVTMEATPGYIDNAKRV